MDKKLWWWIAGGMAIGLITMNKSYAAILKPFLVKWEGFSATPYWDVKQWSWGHGTRVPGSVNDPAKRPTGTITREQAAADMLAYTQKDYWYLRGLIRIPFTADQWAALLSFSYNLGAGSADNLTANINSKKWDALGTQWNAYVYAGGVVNDTLVRRRAAEWQLFKKGLSG